MKNNSNFNNNLDEDGSLDILQEIYKYLFFWKYFVLSIFIFLLINFIYLRYTPKVYDTNARIQILDKKENNLQMPSADDLFSHSKINIENEIEVIKSAPVLNEVIKNLNLNLSVFEVGKILKTRVIRYPFDIKVNLPFDDIPNSSYQLKIDDKILEITDLKSEKVYFFNNLTTLGTKHSLPFDIDNISLEKWDEIFNISFTNTSSLITSLKSSIGVVPVGKKSEIININYRNTNPEYARLVLNELIDVFNNDGIRDRQLIHKRTIDFVNNRYAYLSSQLDSIEIYKQFYKSQNSLVDLKASSSISLQENSISEESIFINENQKFLVTNLLDELKTTDFELLPSNIGIENIEVNSLVSSYNELFLKKQKLNTSAGPNNPYVKQLDISLIDIRKNIIYSLNNYLSQLNLINAKLKSKSNNIQTTFASIPLKERNLRAIERNQQIKESLYLFLLQKGEEAQVSFAVTEPSVKVIEYAISSKKIIYPNSRFTFLLSIILGLAIPFIIIYILFLFNNKVQSREDLEKNSLNVIAEIPFFDLDEDKKVFKNPTDRSIISESFRMMMANIRYLQNHDSSSNVILVTSSIKGEGKTLNALNLALGFSSIGKNVLLIGSDLRNPQLHKYLNVEKNVPGLVDFLVDNKVKWRERLMKPFDNQSLDVLLSGPIPPNPLNLISNGNIDILLDEAKKLYDYIVIDSAPTLLVADTKTLYDKSDITLFMVRCNVTDKEILNNITSVSNQNNFNVGVVLNGVGQKNSYGYSYGYRYGYGYNYKYSYNYGYGYGYSSDNDKS